MRSRLLIAAAAALLGQAAAQAASLRAAPARLDLIAPDSAATLSLRNEDSRPLNVQIRVFRWSQEGGEEILEPTGDVVASPPLTTLPPGADYLVRVVRVTKSPVEGEESYRLLVDELPDDSRRVPGAVTVVVRYSIPIFITSRDAEPPQVVWTAEPSKAGIELSAKNNGSRHLRVSDLKLSDGGKTVAVRNGLVGYVLPGAVMRWSIPRMKGGAVSRRPLTLSAKGDSGAINATVAVSSGR
ncbi:molecular chaperone [Methylocystis sp. WRRC1]|uniref:fimbrial biogenesis chaperone n=1 Tax=Methylocystis sp. WRRC1 TaxID=1732014 RepID=UPI001D135267|nr:molecular chaperone [Methylocystis sp. WRRC1]MCC3246196.1 molecular chaperone [Methylocystis sp. WRRC1]